MATIPPSSLDLWFADTTSVNGKPGLPTDSLSATGGCNFYSWPGGWDESGKPQNPPPSIDPDGRLLLHRGGSTLAYCLDKPRRDREEWWIDFLESSPWVRVDGSKIVVIGVPGRVEMVDGEWPK
jgi:hypothetical protein